MGPAMLSANGRPGDRPHDLVFERLARREPRVAYVGGANGDDPGWFRAIAKSFGNRHGAVVRHAKSGSRADLAEACEITADADVIYVSGGDVELLAERLRRGGLDRAIRRRHSAGASLIGVSAGAIGLCAYWVQFSEDESAGARPTRFRCIGALPFAVDVHDEESDWEELRALLAVWGEDEPKAVVEGYGIPSGAAILCDERGAVTPLGRKPPRRFRLERGRIVELSGA